MLYNRRRLLILRYIKYMLFLSTSIFAILNSALASYVQPNMMPSIYMQISNLPVSYKNTIIESTNTTTKIRSNVSSISDIKVWVKEFGRITNTQWNSRSSVPNPKKFVCSKTYVCHHNKFMKVESKKNQRGLSKNSECAASIIAKVKLDTRDTRKKDAFVKAGLCGIIIITKCHTHSLDSVETLRFLPAESEVRERFIEYFNDGMGIAEACRHHEGILELQEEFSEEALASGRKNPTLRTVQHWHDNWRLLNLGPRTGTGLIDKLKQKQDIYQEQGVIVRFAETPFAAVIITPLMQRAHRLPSSKNIVFVDSTSACDAESHAITFILTVSAAGAVPLGIVITKGQSYDSYHQGFKLFQQAAPESFCGQGYPHIFLTDQSQAEISALNSVWPQSKKLLCIFHVLQAVWRWLWDSKHGIAKEERPTLMKHFQNILYSESIAQAEEAFDSANEVEIRYPHWHKYISDYWDMKEQWVLAWRDATSRGHHTNNFSEVTVRLFKDTVLSRVKAYNVIALIDFSSTVLEKYYCHRLREFANSRKAGARLLLTSMVKKTVYLKPADIIQIDDHQYNVRSEQDPAQTYVVDIKSGNCSCAMGLFGKFCKHQCGVYKFFDVASSNFPPVRPIDRHCIAQLALGEKAPPLSFYQPFLLTEEANPSEFSLNGPLEQQTDSGETTGDQPLLPNNRHCVLQETEEASSAPKMDKIIELLKRFDNDFGSTSSGLEALETRLEKIKTVGQWETFLHTAGNCVPLRRRDGCAIRVQPSSLARRSATVTRGSKRLPAGRPASGEVVKKKRKRHLSQNIKLNQHNAKSHGIGH